MMVETPRSATTSHSVTSSRTGTYYFAYGSNLSTSQMVQRCPSTPPPIAIAKLTSYTWFICSRGYANIIPVSPRNQSRDRLHHHYHATTVWGLIYDLPESDERLLDGYEGWDESECGPVNPREEDRVWKPRERGSCDYNKLYLPVKVTKWLDGDGNGPTRTTVGADFSANANMNVMPDRVRDKENVIRALVYVDEVRVSPGRINDEYILRLSRAALESVPLGIPASWIEAVMGMHGVVWWKGNNNVMKGTERQRSWMTLPKEAWEAYRLQYLLDEEDEDDDSSNV